MLYILNGKITFYLVDNPKTSILECVWVENISDL